MRKCFLTICLAVAMVFCLVPMVSADWVSTHGSAETGAWYGHGTMQTGGFYEGGSRAGYGAMGPWFVAGEANSLTGGLGGSYQGTDFAISGNIIGTESDAEACGLLTLTKTRGDVYQANWAAVGSPNTIAMGGNGSGGDYKTMDFGLFHSSVEGSALTGGITIVGQDNGCFTSEACALTANFALADGGKTNVYGGGEVMTGAQRFGSNGYAVAEGEACFEYSGDSFGAGAAGSQSTATQISIGGLSINKASNSSFAGAVSN